MSDLTPKIKPTFNTGGSLAPDYFERLYEARADPWEFETSVYEASKYAATLAALPRPRYAHALELGCSIGVLTERLAARCEDLLATDISDRALSQARIRCANLTQTRFEKCDLTQDFPAGSFDLILVSEVAYYFSMADLETLRARIADALLPGGHLLLVHYTGPTNYPLSADEVHDFFSAWIGRSWRSLRKTRADKYRLDLLEKA